MRLFVSGVNHTYRPSSVPVQEPKRLKNLWWCHSEFPPTHRCHRPPRVGASEGDTTTENADSRSHRAPSMDLGWLSRVGLMSLLRRSRLLRREHRPQQVKRRKGLSHKKLSFRKESREMRVSQLIRPLVEVPLHV